MEIKNVISNIRKKYGLSQDDMARKLFVTRQAVSRWETGDTTPSIDTIKLISKEYDISINELLDLPENPICQSCGMDLDKIEDFGTNADDSAHTDYCKYCFIKGSFSHNRTLDEMIESNLRFLNE